MKRKNLVEMFRVQLVLFYRILELIISNILVYTSHALSVSHLNLLKMNYLNLFKNVLFFLCVKITEDINLHILQQKFVLFLSNLSHIYLEISCISIFRWQEDFFYQINY